jgi:putative DNA primase/helicase
MSPIEQLRETGDLMALLRDPAWIDSVLELDGVDQDQIVHAIRKRSGGTITIRAVRETLRTRLVETTRSRRALRVVESDDQSWEQRLTRTEDGAIRATAGNALTIVEHHPALHRLLRHDDYRAVTMLQYAPPWDVGEIYPRSISDDDGLRASQWMEHAMQVAIRPDVVGHALVVASRRDRYDPLADYLHSCGDRWDGVDRLDDLACDLFSAANTAHTRTTVRMWMIQAVARALSPGCQADAMLILEGAQGLCKSSALRALAAPEYYSDEIPTLGTKDASIAMSGTWIVEMSELASMTGAAIEKIKAHVTRRTDRYRPPYGRTSETYPRRSVLCATTNETHYLHDSTGNRRFWIVRVREAINVGRIVELRDQLWGEAVARYRAGEHWWLDAIDDREIIEHARTEQEARRVVDPWLSEIADWVAERDWITTDAIFDHLQIRPADRDRSHEMRAARIIRELGFTERCRERTSAGRAYVYRRIGGPA